MFIGTELKYIRGSEKNGSKVLELFSLFGHGFDFDCKSTICTTILLTPAAKWNASLTLNCLVKRKH